MLRRLLALSVPLAVSLALSACGEDSGEGSSAASDDDGYLIESELTAVCPDSLTVGDTETLTATVENTGDVDWPTTLIAHHDRSLDSGDFAVDSMTLDGKEAVSGGGPVGYDDPADPRAPTTPPDSPTFDRMGFSGLQADETAELKVKVTPEEAGEASIVFAVWGETEEAGRYAIVPIDAALQGCENIPVRR